MTERIEAYIPTNEEMEMMRDCSFKVVDAMSGLSREQKTAVLMTVISAFQELTGVNVAKSYEQNRSYNKGTPAQQDKMWRDLQKQGDDDEDR